ncbi:MAG TPA: ABC transporter ATP-binding protein [Candidatus Polarisedimenticolia bacterium]|nr:ABC transporter ATP-binding protein [Candidatus Polarisedimenticolia bacterium]
MDAIAVSFRNVSRSFPRAGGAPLHALRDISVDVRQGARVSIIGRSGSGKSTFLHLAAGIDRPSSGTITVLGHDLARLGDTALATYRRDTVGLIFQFFHLLPHLSVRENVALPGWIAGDRQRQSAARVDELLERVDLAARAGDAVQQLSGGEMQRVAICRALLRRPRLLLADEPTGNLDDEHSRRVMDLLMRLVREEGSTLVYVTHSRELAALADSTWRLHSGLIEST